MEEWFLLIIIFQGFLSALIHLSHDGLWIKLPILPYCNLADRSASDMYGLSLMFAKDWTLYVSLMIGLYLLW